ncbi:sulfur oxidation c-type cytochrome SoxX [Polynucleobacter sp. MG-27-Goln-C1]|uniref:sulfur oxidation c-type cytochrome SoxX n=1 Tax=Polynucleobacter sp. MG-27-Goln-C1 TaxID=1819726 RepID=UPI001C0E466E|nr:sulfur oxidation c-type cytochrome SoxX [Polynucleobacter sp. MG-27-Goln-C1]MBU3613065.1 sulfur oxidation c-type cytochrome SoxX [Polynucleobacter sp. MG-27-Goln-C1]
MRRTLAAVLLGTLTLFLPSSAFSQTWVGDSIVNPLTSSPGDVPRGRAIVVSRQVGLCLLCHSGPFPEERFQGNLAPDLSASVGHSTPAQLRARLVDPGRFNPTSIMPAYYRTTGLNRVAPKFVDQTILTGQEIEDVVAFLVSLQSKPLQ